MQIRKPQAAFGMAGSASLAEQSQKFIHKLDGFGAFSLSLKIQDASVAIALMVLPYLSRNRSPRGYLRTNSRTMPTAIAPTPAQTGIWTVSVFLNDSPIGPSLVSCVSLV